MCFNENFIRSAFDWPIGGGVWLERENEYLKWYNSNDKPMSWKEYCKQNPIASGEYYIADNGVYPLEMCGVTRIPNEDITVMSKELCEAFMAYMKLIQLRNAWVKNYTDCVTFAKIITIHNDLTIIVVSDNTNGLSFLDKDVAQEFLNTFKDLLETAKPLL